MIGDASEDVGEIGFGVEAVEFRGFDQGVQGGRSLATAIGACKEIILPADGNATYRPLCSVIVERQAAVVEASTER
jgi:hypothetical protein